MSALLIKAPASISQGDERKSNPKLIEEWSNDKAVRGHLTPRAILLMSNDDNVVPPVTNGVAYYTRMHQGWKRL